MPMLRSVSKLGRHSDPSNCGNRATPSFDGFASMLRSLCTHTTTEPDASEEDTEAATRSNDVASTCPAVILFCSLPVPNASVPAL